MGLSTVAGGVSPRDVKESFLSSILEDSPHPKFYLTPTACHGILRRAERRGKELPPVLEQALRMQAAIPPEVMAQWRKEAPAKPSASDDGECLTPWDCQSKRIHSENGVWPALYAGEGGGHGYISIAFSANQRDEVRDLHDVAGALCATQTMKQQTFITQSLNPWDCQQSRISTPDGVAPTLAGADDGGGRNPAGLVMTSSAGFSPNPSAESRSIGYEEECSPTITTNTPAVICLDDQGGQFMTVSHNITGTLRAQMHSHQPLVMATQQGGAEICENLCPTITASAGLSGNNTPCVFENHGIDSRYTGPLDVAPTISARAGTGGNNLPLAIASPRAVAFSLDSAESNGMKSAKSTDIPETYAIAGNIIGREVQNGGNGMGYQSDLSYTITATDRHCVFSQRRSDEYTENDIACTQAARQYKDATDLVVAGLDCRSGRENGDLCGTLQAHPGGGYSLNTLHPVRIGNLVRRLTPKECERLQGFPDGWTDMGSDSARYKALGNSVSVPVVEYIMMGIAEAYASGQ
ncbi:DNA cytosine methyltransferase [Ruminococcaceae bacterium OttesenSCG-928-L11]|nr:DNA cytosine methyltransferase [Ruminococcaceae bacterium OttesenSCG-928-L11]